MLQINGVAEYTEPDVVRYSTSTAECVHYEVCAYHEELSGPK